MDGIAVRHFSRRRGWRWLGLFPACGASGEIGADAQAPAFDIIIRNGVIYDGSGVEGYVGDMDECSSFDVRMQTRLRGAHG